MFGQKRKMHNILCTAEGIQDEKKKKKILLQTQECSQILHVQITQYRNKETLFGQDILGW